MMNSMEDLQKLSQQNMDLYMRGFGELNKSWQTLAAELSDYTKRSFDEGAMAMEKLMSAKSVEQAFEIQSSFAKRAYEDYMAQVNKFSTLYADMAKDAYKPFESMMTGGR